MNAPYPRGGFEIAKAREAGLAPAGPVIVVATRKYRCLPDDTHVFLDAGKTYRWDFVEGLNVVVVIDARTKFGTLLADLSEAAQLDVIDVERTLGWLVLSAKPGKSPKTSAWPRHWVQKWLTLECGPVAFSAV